jgi:HD-like signal output (HDOD) protein/prolyl-tRNA editing enzyme YbaK/EbsC (Cys-tRNA(Pro) deacylase)
MTIPKTVSGFIEELGVIYDVLPHPKTDSSLDTARAVYLPPDSVARTYALKDKHGILIAIIPADHAIDIDAVNQHLDRSCRLVETSDVSDIFPDCETGSIPAIPHAYNIQCIVDNSFDKQKNIYLPSGSATDLVCMKVSDLLQITPEMNHFCFSIADPKWLQEPEKPDMPDDLLDMKNIILKLKKLPAMSTTSQRILQLRANPSAGTRDLANIVKLDQSLSAQVIRYARSPIFGYGNKVNTIEDSITKALGFDMVVDMAIGLSVGKSLTNPQEGPLGLHAHWRHSILCATLAQKLAGLLPRDARPASGSPYLAGLLHNFGILLLGHLFHNQFYKLNTSLSSHPESSITGIEKKTIGVSHTQLGSWLVQHWDLPSEILVCVQEHHNEDYTGEHANLCYLVQVANRLLRRHGIGDADNITIPSHMLQALKLEECAAEKALEDVLATSHDIEAMVRQIAA